MTKELNLFEMEVTYTQEGLPGIIETVQSVQNEEDQKKRERAHVKRIIEALLFASSDAIPFHKIREVTDTYHTFKPRILRELIQELQNEYLSEQRSFRLEEIAQGFILRSCEEYSSYIEQLYRNKRTEKLSHAASEVLAIIAYRQPITRPQIDMIRGVDSSGTIYSLLERGLIEPLGKLEAPGRPTLFGVTKEFLQHFGLKDLNDLPKIEG